MKKEIIHTDNLNISGKGIIRNAVRGIVLRKSQILLIYSPVNGDYKLPGGGIDKSETHDAALQREILEECGLNVKSIKSLIGIITEYDKAKEDNFNFFAMQSFYYSCELKDYNFKEQKLDKYEKELGFTPKWISLEKAIETNLKVINSGKYPRWIKRDTEFLKYVASNIHLFQKTCVNN